MSGGGTLTVKVVSNQVKIRWDTRVIATPLMGKATSSLYDIVCPTSGTIGTGQTADADGIPLGANSDNLATLYYVLPTASANTQFLNNFRVITSTNTTTDLDSRWMALATLNTDANPTLKWLPGAVVLPLPDNGQQIQWGSNVQQLGRGASKLTLDGGTGNVNVPGVLTITSPSPAARVVPRPSPKGNLRRGPQSNGKVRQGSARPDPRP